MSLAESPLYWAVVIALLLLVIIVLTAASAESASKTERDLEQERRRNDLLMIALRRLEWGAKHWELEYCRICMMEKIDGHTSDCIVGRALGVKSIEAKQKGVYG